MEAAPWSQSAHPRPEYGKIIAALSLGLALTAGLALRLWMFNSFFEVEGDSLVYGDLAKNLLLHGRYALTLPYGGLHPSLLRLPGYPLFLAFCFRLFGLENYAAPCYLQIALDLMGCLLLWNFVRRIAPPALRTGAAHCALWLAALCPFTAIYSVLPLCESLTLFFLALALWATVRFLDRARWSTALCFTFAVTSIALLRPDGALAALALAPALLLSSRSRAGAQPRLLPMAVVCALLALAPFAVWTWRNWCVFHLVQPLAPRSATDPGTPAYPGWERWVATWCLDYVSTYQIYWNVPGAPLHTDQLPARAFDSPAQRAETEALALAYNGNGFELTRSLDAGFARLAAQRTATHPLRTYLWLPLGRLAGMWLRPRTENLPVDLDWWVYSHHHAETRFSWAYAGLNLLYLLLACAGLCLRPRLWRALLAYLLLRSVLLLTITAPEPRYTIEGFPLLIVLGGLALYRFTYWVWLSVLKVNAPPGNA